MINDYEKRGLKMIDVLNFSKALKIARIKKYPLTMTITQSGSVSLMTPSGTSTW